MTSRVVVEADGGSRGNPGAASYGALVRDAATGALIASRGETIGTATNNVAEYRGLVAGLELAREHAPGAQIEVRMDSKLVIEQMAGRWKIKHAAMRDLAAQARALAQDVTDWVWVPRAQNAAADALANEALDEQARTGRPAEVGSVASGEVGSVASGEVGSVASGEGTGEQAGDAAPARPAPTRGWQRDRGEPTTMLLVRHGVTPLTHRKAFSGRGGDDPELTDEGHEQAARVARWIARRHDVDAVVSSPLRRCRQSADAIARETGRRVVVDEGVIEASFGRWEGLTFAEVMREDPQGLEAWLSSPDVAPPGGDSFADVAARVERARDRLVDEHAGRTVVVVSHVTPIKLLVRLALDAPMHVLRTMELAPASITEIGWWPDGGGGSLRSFSVVPD